MGNATIPLTSFTGGEWSPRLHGRVDIDKYSSACEVLENMVLYPHGGITRRMGMEFIEDAKFDDVRLVPFEYNREQAYVIEFGEGYVRFFRDGAQIAPLGTPLEIPTDYFAADIRDISFAQSNDILYLVHRSYPPRKLERTGPDVFAMSDIVFVSPPSAWGSLNYPGTVTLFQGRLVFGGNTSNPQTIWMSKPSVFNDFTLASGALEFTLSSTQNNSIQWIVPGSKLLIGTTGGEFSLDIPTNTGAVIQAKLESNFGSKSGRVQLVGNGVLYISRDGKKVREMAYSFDADGYASPELSILSEHLFRSGVSTKQNNTQGIKEFDFAQNPDGILWTVMNDGTFCGFTYLKSQQVQGWHSHKTDGDVKSVCTIETDTGTEVWFAVLRNGATRIERMAKAFEGTSANDIACAYLDSFLSRSGSPVSSLSGLTHLEGKTVSILADGQAIENKVVTGGAVTLEFPASNIIVGLPYSWRVIPLRLEGGSPMGFSQGKKKRIVELICRVENSAGISHRDPNRTQFDSPIPSRSFGDNFDASVKLFSGDLPIFLHPNWDRDGQFELYGNSPLPVTILMIAAKVIVND